MGINSPFLSSHFLLLRMAIPVSTSTCVPTIQTSYFRTSKTGRREKSVCKWEREVCVSERERERQRCARVWVREREAGCSRSFYGRACVNENFFRTILFGEGRLPPPPSFFRTCGCSSSLARTNFEFESK